MLLCWFLLLSALFCIPVPVPVLCVATLAEVDAQAPTQATSNGSSPGDVSHPIARISLQIDRLLRLDAPFPFDRSSVIRNGGPPELMWESAISDLSTLLASAVLSRSKQPRSGPRPTPP
ncbi:hypothetical protein EDB81DRAFT_474257 [Dactylonectria macrodidyma]|uniref:Secreted protein n=1 Tax=Dactylonectria macrodidyma TaxID=307937 RepID=A0A9P9EYC3_9HYPO|nr:hypothetical protein EDB81DRAFT_474257 [Dactylonectria macrodidyma]